jgi:hypothetical protein
MATSSSAAASSEPLEDEVPPLPPKLRRKPQAKGNVGEGKLYADKAEFDADVELWEQEQQVRQEQVKERERAQGQLRERGREKRDRSSRQRQSNDSARRVQQRREANPNVLPQAVADMFEHIGAQELRKWCENKDVTPSIIAEGLPPPQCLIKFLDDGGSPDAHPPIDPEYPRSSRDALLQLATEGPAGAGPRVVEVLLQRGASVDGAMTRASPLYRAVEYWKPITKACKVTECPHYYVEGGKCFCIAHATAHEKVIRLLLNAGAIDKHAAQHIAELSLDGALDHWQVKQNSKHTDALRRGWSDAKLHEMQALFLRLHS